MIDLNDLTTRDLFDLTVIGDVAPVTLRNTANFILKRVGKPKCQSVFIIIPGCVFEKAVEYMSDAGVVMVNSVWWTKTDGILRQKHVELNIGPEWIERLIAYKELLEL